MANLLNVIDSRPPEVIQEVPERLKGSWEKATAEQDKGKWLRRLLPSALRYHSGQPDDEVRKWGLRLIKERDEKVSDLVWDAFLDVDQLPVPMSDRAPANLTNLMETPRAPLTDLMAVTTKLGFVCIPWAYLSPASYKEEGRSMQEAIKTFGQLDSKLDVYVICPPTYYSFEKHLQAEDPNQQIFAGKNEQAFMALKLILPAMRAMRAQIDSLQANQRAMHDSTREALRALQRNQETMKSQLEQTQRDVATQLKQMQEVLTEELRRTTEAAVIEAQTVLNTGRASKAQKAQAQKVLDSIGTMNLKDARSAVDELQRVVFDLLEPLMFAVKKGTSLRDRNALAYIGPCWGPDFADIIATASGLAVDSDKRKASEQMLQAWGNIYEAKHSSGRGRRVESYNQDYGRPRSPTTPTPPPAPSRYRDY